MQILRFILIFFVLIVIASYAFGAPTYMKGENNTSVHIDESAYGMTKFYCNSKVFFTDIQLPKFQGCHSEDISFGPGGLDAKILTVFYDWEDLPNAPKQAKKVTFLEKPDGEVYRLKNTDFLTNERLEHYFEQSYGRGLGTLGPTDISLANFSVRNVQSYGNTFCVTHYLKFPFTGTMGWCQNDRLVGGEIGYLDGAMTFSRAAILAQNHVDDNKLKIRGGKLFHPQTVVTLKKDKHGNMYWGFGVPAQKMKHLASYGFRVYFNGAVFANEYAKMPSLDIL